MVTTNPRQIVDYLVVVLDTGLRRVRVRSETYSEVVEFEIREGVETRETETGHGEALRRTTIRDARLVYQVLAKSMVQGIGEEPLLARYRSKELWQTRGVINVCSIGKQKSPMVLGAGTLVIVKIDNCVVLFEKVRGRDIHRPNLHRDD